MGRRSLPVVAWLMLLPLLSTLPLRSAELGLCLQEAASLASDGGFFFPPGACGPEDPIGGSSGERALSLHFDRVSSLSRLDVGEPEELEPFGGSFHLPEDDDDGLPAFHLRLRNDLVDLVRLPGQLSKRDVKMLALAAVGVGVVRAFDDEILGWVSDGGAGDSEQLAREVKPLGQRQGLALVAALWLGSRSMGKSKLRDASADALEAFLISGGITNLLKSVSGRSRPWDGDGSFELGSGGGSFPSGDVTQIFAFAAVYSAHYDEPWVDALAWTMAGFVGWERMRLGAHWPSDVLAGALIGAATGRWIVRRNRPELRERKRFAVAPEIGDRRYGLVARFEF